jgi:hypothetical protein
VGDGPFLDLQDPGVYCPRVLFVGVNGSDNPYCPYFRLAQLLENQGGFIGGDEAAFASLIPFFRVTSCAVNQPPCV